MSSKKLKSIPVSCTDEDRDLVDQCCNLQPTFPPSRSQMALLFIRDGVARLLGGETTLEAIYNTHADGPEAAAAAIGGADGARRAQV